MTIREMANIVFPKEMLDEILNKIKMKKFFKIKVLASDYYSHRTSISVNAYVENAKEALKLAYKNVGVIKILEQNELIPLPATPVLSYKINGKTAYFDVEELSFDTID